MSQVRLDFMGPVSSTGGKVGICSDYLRNVGKGMKSSFQNSDKEFQSSSNSCPPFSLSKVSSMRADNHFQMLRKNVKSLLEQLQVCIFAEIVFGVRCTLISLFYTDEIN